MTTPTTTALVTEDALAREFSAALDRCELPEKFFYWFPTSVRAWINLCSDGAYRNYVRSRSLIEEHAAAVTAQLPAGAVTAISLGAGQGTKDLLVLGQLARSGRQPSYLPVDASQSLLEMACASALDAGVSALGVKADMNDPGHLAAIRDLAPAPPRLLMLIGNTLGAFDPLAMARQLARLLRPEDHLLVDGEIFDQAGTLAGYDNPLNRQFAFGPLRGVGLVEPRDGTLHFETVEDPGRAGLYRVSKHFRAGPRPDAVGGRRDRALERRRPGRDELVGQVHAPGVPGAVGRCRARDSGALRRRRPALPDGAGPRRRLSAIRLIVPTATRPRSQPRCRRRTGVTLPQMGRQLPKVRRGRSWPTARTFESPGLFGPDFALLVPRNPAVGPLPREGGGRHPPIFREEHHA
ncbi:MAG: L-histidine N(alpha)-methyltransferase [Vicinamibacterales bacterium]